MPPNSYLLVSSRATETAAKITAAATMNAAWIQLFAASFVLLAGVCAYFGAVRQVRLAEREHKAKVAAYISRMTEIAVGICDHAWINSFYTKSDAQIIIIEPLTVPEELGPSNWFDHALLGENVVTAISKLYTVVKIFVDFTDEMRWQPAEAKSEFGSPCIVGYDEEQEPEVEQEPGIDTYRNINQALENSAEKLRSLLVSPIMKKPRKTPPSKSKQPVRDPHPATAPRRITDLGRYLWPRPKR